MAVTSKSHCKQILEDISQQEDLSLDTPINIATREGIQSLLTLGDNAGYLEGLFSVILEKVEKILSKSKRCRSMAIRSEKARPALFRFRAFELPEILEKYQLYFTTSPFIWQEVVEKVYTEQLMKLYECPSGNFPAQPRCLDPIERNAVRYASGFIVRKVLRKYSKAKSSEAERWVECLKEMIKNDSGMEASEEDEDTSSFEEYTKTWLQATDRGGLCHVSDDTFRLFEEIEIVIYKKLKKCIAGEQVSLSVMIDSAMEDEDILYLWSIIADGFVELLKVMVQEWIILRGHSLRSHFMEVHKKATKEATKGKKSLRKELRRSRAAEKK